eukprot:8630754-Alexandrium_andersonii.AAC.1
MGPGAMIAQRDGAAQPTRSVQWILTLLHTRRRVLQALSPLIIGAMQSWHASVFLQNSRHDA